MVIKTESTIDEMIVNEGEVVVSNIEEVSDSPVTVYLHSDIGKIKSILIFSLQTFSFLHDCKVEKMTISTKAQMIAPIEESHIRYLKLFSGPKKRWFFLIKILSSAYQMWLLWRLFLFKAIILQACK